MAADVRSWQSVVAFFDGLAGQDPVFVPMRALVHEIAISDFGSGLYPWTSMHDLCISQTPSTNPQESPHLRISLKSASEIEFCYVDTAIEARQWRRVESPEYALGRLLVFFDQFNWFGRRPL